MDPSFKERERERRGGGRGDRSKEKDRKRKSRRSLLSCPPPPPPKQEGLEFGRGEGGKTQGAWKPDPEGYRRLEELSAPATSSALFSAIFLPG